MQSRLVLPSQTPGPERTNPFAGIPVPPRITPATEDYAQTPSRPKLGRAPFSTLGETFKGETSNMPRIQRKNSSRSQIHRQNSESSAQSSGGIYAQPWHVESNPHCNGGLKNAVASVGERLRKKLWIGTLGSGTDTLGDTLRKDIDKRMMEQCDSQPVWIPDAEFESCYDGFCHQVCLSSHFIWFYVLTAIKVLWPCLHYAIPDAPKTKIFYESAAFKQYQAVNQRFADAIIANYQEGDISRYINVLR